MTEVLN